MVRCPLSVFHGLAHYFLAFRVQGTGSLIENQQPGFVDQGPGDNNPLPLAAGQFTSALADDGLQALGQACYEIPVPRRRAALPQRLRPSTRDLPG